MNAAEDFILRHEGNQKEVMLYFHNLLTSFPTVSSAIKYRIPFYDQNTWVCYLNPLKNGKVSLCFLRGYELSNEQGLLESKGRKQVLSVDFGTVDEIPKDTIREIINEALFLDETVPYNPKGKRIQE
ncbi:MAG: DUF1801 domain-containing protein [Gracilimonas sp.]|uniref:DUF1801 domain-containing protein n=1 Tax=Gracilimonas TaxID=649462 RepID=UPI001B23B8E1|nr:DUF1801 domain-containing protein [Gracilimonas sp.]MBO6585016.1 DUF1801 domain-containing protein [Gracilimonas sp.]MBO6615713.1 DUF1801 domain-containing protein [Gracilimonas sp.]